MPAQTTSVITTGLSARESTPHTTVKVNVHSQRTTNVLCLANNLQPEATIHIDRIPNGNDGELNIRINFWQTVWNPHPHVSICLQAKVCTEAPDLNFAVSTAFFAEVFKRKGPATSTNSAFSPELFYAEAIASNCTLWICTKKNQVVLRLECIYLAPGVITHELSEEDIRRLIYN